MAGLKLSLLLTFCFVAYVSANKGCSINIKDFKMEPVMLISKGKNASYDLFKPDGQVTDFAEGTKLLLLCTGKKNTLKLVNAQQLELVCKGGDLQDNKGKKHTIANLECSSIPSSNLQVTDESCSQGKGKIYKAGFEYNDDQFATVFTICYNAQDQVVYYTHNTINGRAIAYSISESKRRSFTADGMGMATTKVNKLYTTAHQVSHFDNIYGQGQSYVTKKEFLARGHLTPDADGVCRYDQLATYYYANVKPEFQSVNAGNWLRAESLARKAAEKLGRDLEAYNGVMGVVAWEDASGNLVEAYLDEEKQFEIPKYFFKVLLDTAKKTGIVFVSINDPHLKSEDVAANTFCKNVCHEANLEHADFPRTERGFTFCCNVSEFLEHFDDLPADVSADSLLTI